MPSLRSALLVAALGASAGGCAVRDAPYRFRAPVLTAVRAPELRASRHQRLGIQELRSRRIPSSAEVVRTEPAPWEAETPAGGVVAMLRAPVGTEIEDSSNLAFALGLVSDLGSTLAAQVRAAESGQALWDLAEDRDAIGGAAPLTGDLVVFDDVDEDVPASLVGVVVTTAEGTIEFVYLARGMVRRGWVTPAHPDVQRDARGAILNTFVRAGRPADDLGAEYLAGRLYRGFLRLDRLAD